MKKSRIDNRKKNLSEVQKTLNSETFIGYFLEVGGRKINIIFNTDHSEKNEKFRQHYNQLAFHVPMIIEELDALSESTVYRQNLKKTGNMFLAELEKVSKEHFDQYNTFGLVENPEGAIDARDVYNITSKAYTEAYNFFKNKKPSEIVTYMELIRKHQESGLDLEDFLVEFKPLMK
ncbi:hypothetical protein [uncultured Chryseobacterium sp.]|uniref:hypothetical protein n=1 Tax=uncultured Chryseobacterium sp. TaxID=259322 RepID=UPI0025F19ED9|nr:hypothetical protein [uncultured Chryseobacterium sp.]